MDVLFKGPLIQRRANDLLREFLTDEQWADWKASHGFNVLASDGTLYRINAFAGSKHTHYTLVRGVQIDAWDDRWIGTCCWVQACDGIPADQALAVLMYLKHNPAVAWRLGCHESVPRMYSPQAHAHKYSEALEPA